MRQAKAKAEPNPARDVLAGAMSEDDLLDQVLALARLRGWRVYHVRDSRRGVTQGPGAEGFPDLVMARRARDGRPGHICYRELKREGGKLTAAQAEWGALLLAVGADWAVWRPSDWPAIADTLAGTT